MHRWRTVVALLVTLSCLALAVHIAQARQKEPSGPGVEKSVRPDDDPIIVKPKGSGGVIKTGFDWTHKKDLKDILKSGKDRQFRCDLLERMTVLKAGASEANLKDAVEVTFYLPDFKYSVRKVGNGYQWDIPHTHTPEACNKEVGKDCAQSGVPPEYMDPDGKGTIKAKFTEGSAPVEVQWVWMVAKDCK